jgi:hypothetical protein
MSAPAFIAFAADALFSSRIAIAMAIAMAMASTSASASRSALPVRRAASSASLTPMATTAPIARVARAFVAQWLARACLFAACLFGILLYGSRALAMPFDPEGQDWEGLAQLVQMARNELGPTHVVVESTLAMGDLKRQDGVFLVHPQRALDADALESFMRAGGRVILFDDYGSGDELLQHFGIKRVTLPARPAQMLRDNPSLAIARPASEHPIVNDIAPVVTNHGTGLEEHGLSPLLVVHGSDGEPDVLLSVAGAVGHGRLIVVGDASIAINTMLRYPGNRALCRAALRYAIDDDVWGMRGGTLHILVNGFRTTGAFGDESRAGAALGEVQRSTRQWMTTLRHDGMAASTAYAAAVAIGLGVLTWVSARVGRTHRASVPRFARPVPVVAHGGIAGHAAVLGSPGTSRVLALLELKAALEEALATKLGLDRAPAHDELAAKALSAGVLDKNEVTSLSSLLVHLDRVEAIFARISRPITPGTGSSVRDSNVIAVAAKVRELLKATR